MLCSLKVGNSFFSFCYSCVVFCGVGFVRSCGLSWWVGCVSCMVKCFMFILCRCVVRC